MNPKRDWVQARIELKANVKYEIVFEAQKFIDRLYLALIFGFTLFTLISIVKFDLRILFFIVVMPVVFYSNYRKLNNDILELKKDLSPENNKASSNSINR